MARIMRKEDRIKRELTELVPQLAKADQQETKTKAAYEAVYAPFKAQHSAVIEAKTNAAFQKKALATQARDLIADLYRENGQTATEDGHFTVSVKPGLTYNTRGLIKWLTANMPVALLTLAQINEAALDLFMQSNTITSNLHEFELAPVLADMPVKVETVPDQARVQWKSLPKPEDQATAETKVENAAPANDDDIPF